MRRSRRGSAWITFAMLWLAACDFDARRCKEEREDVLSNYAACNRSCERNENAASCKTAKRMAAEVCTAHRDNVEACKIACDNGHTDSCAPAGVATTGRVPTSATPPSAEPSVQPTVDLLAEWVSVSLEGVSLKLPKRPQPKTVPVPGGHTMFVLGEDSADGHHVELAIIKLKGDVGEKIAEKELASAFATVPGKTATTRTIVRQGIVAKEVRITAKKPVGAVVWVVNDHRNARVVRVTVTGNERFSDAIAAAVLASLSVK